MKDNQPKTNNVDIRDVSHVTMVTDVQQVSSGARLRLAKSRLMCLTQLHD